MASINNNDSDYLPPLFDLSDAPILDFSTEDSVEDPSSLISKVSQYFDDICERQFSTKFSLS